MWKVDVSKLCRQHLLGEHNECHSFVGTINKWKKGGKGAVKDFPSSKYVSSGFVEIHYLKSRHEELADEMLRRGYNHQSPLPTFEEFVCGKVDVAANEIELRRRCKECKF